jgi:hypothetical protein
MVILNINYVVTATYLHAETTLFVCRSAGDGGPTQVRNGTLASISIAMYQTCVEMKLTFSLQYAGALHLMQL